VPTDNLYKFVAITGMVVVAYSLLGPWRQVDHTWKEVFDLKTETATLTAEVETFTSEVRFRRELMRGQPTAPLGSAAERADRISRQNEESRYIEEQNRRLQVANARIEGNREKLAYLVKRTATLQRLGLAGLALGVVLGSLGFAGWYIRIQRLQDRRLVRETEDDGPSEAPGQVGGAGDEAEGSGS